MAKRRFYSWEINILKVKLNKNYIKCNDCKKVGFNDDDSVCIYCGSKDTKRLTKPI